MESPESSASSRKRRLEETISQEELLEIHQLLENDDFDEFEEMKEDCSIIAELFDDDPFEEENEDVEIIEKPLYIPELLQNILGYLDTETLKRCREVSSFWNDNASHLLLRQNKFQIILKYREQIQRIRLRNQYTVADLHNYITQSGGTPCLSFHVSTKYIHEQQVQNFFTDNGRHIRELCIQCTSALSYNLPDLLALLRLLLIQQAPNLRHLTLELSESNYLPPLTDFAKKKAKLKLFECNKEASILSTLKSLTIKNIHPLTLPYNLDVLKEILSCSRNLQEIKLTGCDSHLGLIRRLSRCYILEFVDSLIQTNRISAVNTISINALSSSLRNLEKFSRANPCNIQTLQLNEFSFIHRNPETSTQFSTILNNIFKSCQSNLRSLTMEPLSHLPQVVIPCLPNVTDLYLNGTLNLDVTTILPCPPRPRFSRQHYRPQEMYNTFPNVRRLTFSRNLGGELLKNCLRSFTNPTSSPLPSVREVTAGTWPSDSKSCFKTLSTLFPNLQRLFIRPAETRFDLPIFLKHVIKNLPHLKYLKLQNFEMKSATLEEFTKSAIALDSAVTGIPFEILKENKKELMESMKDASQMEKWITRPCLNDFKGLAHLEIELCVGLWPSFSEFTRNENSHGLLSVSLPQLKRIPKIKIELSGDFVETEENAEEMFHYLPSLNPDFIRNIAPLLGDVQSIVELKMRNFHPLDRSSDEDDDWFEHSDYENYDDDEDYLYDDGENYYFF